MQNQLFAVSAKMAVVLMDSKPAVFVVSTKIAVVALDAGSNPAGRIFSSLI